MMYQVGVFALVVLTILAGASAQRSPYLSSRTDFGVLPIYRTQNEGLEPEDRLGDDEDFEVPKLQEGTLETKPFYDRVAEWPEEHKPFWYLNSKALQEQRARQQFQAAAQAAAQAAQQAP